MDKENMDFAKMKELEKLLELKDPTAITAAVAGLSEEDARAALVIALLAYRKNIEQNAMQQAKAAQEPAGSNNTQTAASPAQARPSPDDFALSVNEYNLALMVLFTLGGWLPVQAEQAIRTALSSDNGQFFNQQAATRLFTECRSCFSRAFQKERAEYGYTGAQLGLITGERIYLPSPATPAINVLHQFRVEDPYELLYGDKPNLGNIRAVKPADLAAHPSTGLLSFMQDLAAYYGGLAQE